MTVRLPRLFGGITPLLAVCLGLLLSCPCAFAQLRIVSYNTATGNVDPGVQTARSGMDIVLKSIGEETINGIARPIDVLLLQEQFSTDEEEVDDHFDDVATQSFVDLLNRIYGAGIYSRGYIDAATSAPTGQGGGPGIVYNTQTIQLVEELRFGTVNGSAQARSTLRYQLRPVGYNSDADFYAYNSHYKAGSSSEDQDRREIEATSIRTNPSFGSDALGAGAHAIFVGDYNMSSSNEDAFQTLIAAGDGQANDPLNRLGSWSGNPSFADIHTQAPCLTDCGGLTTGGVDDRYDFQLMTGEFLDGVGLSYIGPTVPGMSGTTHSYRAFGNNGSTFNQSINNRNGSNQITNTYAFNGVTSYTHEDILDALATVSDHLPVVADFQLPDAPSNPQLLAAKWTFETSIPAAANMAEITNIAPEIGMGNARGVHASASTDYSNPTGNGSPESLSSTNWAVNDFYEFQISTEGFENISISFDQTSSNTGPKQFGIYYGTSAGGPFTNTNISYDVLANASPNPVWTTSAHLDEFFYEFDLSSIAALNDQATMILRLVDLSTVSANDGTVAGGGTNRVDNLSIYYYAISEEELPGDFNFDGTVDAADYVVWRKTNSADQVAYNLWVTNFGRVQAGSGGNQPGAPGVPEPAACLLLAVGICLVASRRGTLAAWTRQP